MHGPYVGEGRAKLLLFGEHAAVYGHPAVGLGLSERLRASIEFTAAFDAAGERRSWRFEGVEESDKERLRTLLPAFASHLPGSLSESSACLRIDSTVPRGLGFGSSAALTVALAGAFHSASSQPASDAAIESVWQDAHEAEKVFHGTPSGIDTGLALLGGLQRFLPHPPRLPDARPLAGFPLYLVTGAVPRLESCVEKIRAIRAAVERGDEEVGSRLRALGGMADEASLILEGPEASGAPRLGLLAEEAMAELRELGLSTPALDMLLDAGRAEGALGGKLSGAGGGGAFFLLFSGTERAESAAQALRVKATEHGIPTASLIRARSFRPGNAKGGERA